MTNYEIKPTAESTLRLSKVIEQMHAAGMQALLLADNANLYYLTGHIFRGYIYITPGAEPLVFVMRPASVAGEHVCHIRKPEQIPSELTRLGIELPSALGIELDDISYSDAMRLARALGVEAPLNASTVMRTARMVKTPREIELIRIDGGHQAAAYGRIRHIYTEDMTDLEFQIELEREMRLEGCLGMYRTSGPLMEINMGSVLNGENADAPTPYDFAVGGAGIDPSLPVGADGRTMRRGTSVMVDMCGNYNGYQSDMTRVWSIGTLPDEAYRAHDLSRRILRALEKEAKPGTPVARLYEIAIDMVRAEGLEDYFMGHSQHAAFIGHGVGIQLNELPVVTPRSRHILEQNMVIALEPKFVIPEVGAVGVENTYCVGSDGLECLTIFPEEISDLTL